MKVKRIVTNIKTDEPDKARQFYEVIFGMSLVMDQGWIMTYGSGERMDVQISFASEGGSGTLVPDISIEVDDLEEVLLRCVSAGVEIVYGPAEESWGVKRFYVRDPFGKLVNVLVHIK
ncbi:MAG: glyoxalase [Pedobacter sp.]|nr:MAG: glyoxalase [Pedobacter sp.]